MEQIVPKSSSNSPSGDGESSGTLWNASRQSETSSKTLTSSAGSRESVDSDDISPSSYEADDERELSDPNSEAEHSDQSDGSRPPSPMLNEQGVPFFKRNENAETEMMHYNIRKKKEYAAARIRRLEHERMLSYQRRLLNFTRSGEPEPYYHPSNYIDMNTYRSSLAELTRPLTSPKLKASDAPSTPKGRSKTLPSSVHSST